MPAKSKAQRQVMAIAEHHPEQLYKRNRGLLQMSAAQLHEFAATKEKKLPAHVPQRGAENRYGRLRHGRGAR